MILGLEVANFEASVWIFQTLPEKLRNLPVALHPFVRTN